MIYALQSIVEMAWNLYNAIHVHQAAKFARKKKLKEFLCIFDKINEQT